MINAEIPRGARLYLAKVRFVSPKNGKLVLGEKRYDYYIDSTVIKCSENSPIKIGLNEVPLYQIVNENGYDYRGSLVFIEELIPVYQHEMRGSILRIAKLIRTSSINKDTIEGMSIPQEKEKIFITTKPVVNSTFDELTKEVEKVSSTIDDLIKVTGFEDLKERKTIKEKDKGENKMNFMNKFNFGPAHNVKMSLYGPAFRNSENGYISYDKAGSRWVDVQDFILDFDKCCYLMPIAVKDIKANDFILHNGNYVRVMKVKSDGVLEVEKLATNEIITVFPVKNMFGFDFYTKLFCLAEGIFGEANANNPFGNPMMLMALMGKEGNDSFKDMLPFLMMGNMNTTSNTEDGEESTTSPTNIFNNPMMLYFLMKD